MSKVFKVKVRMYSVYTQAIFAPLGFETRLVSPLNAEKWKHLTESQNMNLSFQILVQENGTIIVQTLANGTSVLDEIKTSVMEDAKPIQFNVRDPVISCKYLIHENSMQVLKRFQITLTSYSDFSKIYDLLSILKFKIKYAKPKNIHLASPTQQQFQSPLKTDAPIHSQMRDFTCPESIHTEPATSNLSLEAILNSMVYPTQHKINGKSFPLSQEYHTISELIREPRSFPEAGAFDTPSKINIIKNKDYNNMIELSNAVSVLTPTVECKKTGSRKESFILPTPSQTSQVVSEKIKHVASQMENNDVVPLLKTLENTNENPILLSSLMNLKKPQSDLIGLFPQDRQEKVLPSPMSEAKNAADGTCKKNKDSTEEDKFKKTKKDKDVDRKKEIKNTKKIAEIAICGSPSSLKITKRIIKEKVKDRQFMKWVSTL
ncbi:hypothetical protein KAFR_0B05160 [Kazachstania africana CBS 2517]|uniref:Uncharacterized protein n=1 Tax=Kazachstania africana (strain ATCC 22294 / BCRC 22015 / CBS 2517 / CECT 1963 / NBRC 1671 / NRRL Y-8276) TaxID=1071382 RepID=H2AR12_KAZAF|nr:hypothetical protein KAFR_0B05160 [Kazachstania africana CBS 2517]CCF56812.1 hypothetical protein KAFR_0B05160 [Kazachstania africana CBS 2517]